MKLMSFLIAIVGFALVGCGETEQSETAVPPSQPRAAMESESAPEQSEPETEEEKFMSEIRKEAGIEGMDTDESLDKLRADQTWSEEADEK